MAKSRIRKAERQMSYMKALCIAPSGGGKSYSFLRLATGFSEQLKKLDGKEHRIGYINTEANRGEMYADKFDYDILDLQPPYTPEAYMDAMDDFIDEGYDILIMDSITHEWSGQGGCLELHAQQKGKDSYMNWKNVSPRHERFMEKIINSKIHIFATVRGKDAYERVEQGGRIKYEKVAYGYDQRKNLEYLFFVSFMIDLESHYAQAVKDNTEIFTMNALLSEKQGKELCNWAYNTTSDDVQSMRKAQQDVIDKTKAQEEQEFKNGGIYKKQAEKELRVELGEVVQDIIDIAKGYASQGRREEVIGIIGGDGNPRHISNIKKAVEIKHKLQEGM